jgi:phosphatidylserine decarboxylase
MKKTDASLLDYLKLGSLYVLPQHAISRLVYRATRIESRFVPSAIHHFSRVFKVNWEDAIHQNPKDYASFNDFFTRPIKAERRPITQGLTTIASPVDGTISEYGKIQQGQIIQAKGHHYTVDDLLAEQNVPQQTFANGQFMTIYLSPRDYHRIHSPLTAQLYEQRYIPGRLYSVAPFTVKTLTGIFARNERVVTLFDTAFGKMAVVMVGAINVAAIETVWDGLVTPPTKKQVAKKTYHKDSITFNKGDELGRFNMGSTVILLFENPDLVWDKTVGLENSVQMGQRLAHFNT